MKRKIISSSEAVALVRSGDVLAVQGFIGLAHPEELSTMLEKRFVETGSPRDLTLIFSAGQGNGQGIGKGRCTNHYGHKGFVKKIIGGHFNLSPSLGEIITANEVEAYNLPQGVILNMFRNMAGRRPGVITHVGLKTFADPRVEGGRLNSKTTKDIVEVITINDKEYLHYLPFEDINICFIRGTTADEDGNITMEKEAALMEAYHIALATKRCGGIVVAQVERLAANGTLPPKDVKVPGILVDYVILAKPELHWQANETFYNPAFSGELRVPMDSLPPMELDERKVMARRGAMELTPESVINLGIGVPTGVAVVANEEGLLDSLTLTLESGPIGGVAAGGGDFGAEYNPTSIIEHPNMFDLYDAGGLDIAYLGLAQADEEGNINVSKFGTRISGCGGFVNITQNAKKVIFCGTLTTGGLKVGVKDGRLNILQEGKNKKLVKRVQQITFSGVYAREVKQPVLYITERAVFDLTADGMLLTEIAPGVDLEKDVLNQVEFVLKVSPKLKLMDKRIFEPAPMNIKDAFFAQAR